MPRVGVVAIHTPQGATGSEEDEAYPGTVYRAAHVDGMDVPDDVITFVKRFVLVSRVQIMI